MASRVVWYRVVTVPAWQVIDSTSGVTELMSNSDAEATAAALRSQGGQLSDDMTALGVRFDTKAEVVPAN